MVVFFSGFLQFVVNKFTFIETLKFFSEIVEVSLDNPDEKSMLQF